MATTLDVELDEREQALHHAARLRGLALIRTGETFALVRYRITGATLDQIADFLAGEQDLEVEDRRPEDSRLDDLRAMLKAERALLAELQQQRRKAGEHIRGDDATEAALAEIRRRIAEIQGTDRPMAPRAG